MNRPLALRACMQVLVLLNLVFVQMTGIAGWHWLAPLYALTLGAPLLERYRERRGYRLLWNGGVLCFFVVLVRHALGANLAYVLEDGLVMALLCQVHLLNNIRSSQQPDLLFFNAFLIAIITGFMNRGVGFAVGFLAFAPAYVIGLQLLSATRGGARLAPEAVRRLVLDGGRRAAILLGISLVAFLFWPRDFERKAILHGRIEFSPGGPSQLGLGFNKSLELGRKGDVVSSDRPALRVTLLEGQTREVPTLWRGVTLGAVWGGSWSRLDPLTRRALVQADEPWRGKRGRLVRAEPTPGAPRVQVVRFEQGTEQLFVPLGARLLELDREHEDTLLRAHSDGSVDTTTEEEMAYELTLGPASADLGGAVEAPPAWLEPYSSVTRTGGVEEAARLALRLLEDVPDDMPQHELVLRVSDHLTRNYSYLAPGAEDAASSLNEFLRGTAGGHCEYFASALATTLRMMGIPCRVVTGFRSSRWDAQGKVLSIQMRDAHAWVEVHDPEAGWYTVDPSPRSVEQAPRTSLWIRIRAAASSAWERVTDFGPQRRAALLAWVRAAPRRIANGYRERPVLGSFLSLSALTLLVGLTRRRRRGLRPSVSAYRRALRRAGLRLEPGETPRELLARARLMNSTPERVEALIVATREHEEARYEVSRQ